jgi:hypothetical protein
MYCWTLHALLLTLLTVRGTNVPIISADDYSALMDSLLNGYSKKVRPVRDQSKSVDMAASLWISSINNVIVAEQKIIISAHLQVTWRDEMITWNATEWGIEMMQFNQVLKIWIFQISWP